MCEIKGARLLGHDGGRQREATAAGPGRPPGAPGRHVRGHDDAEVSAQRPRQRGVSGRTDDIYKYHQTGGFVYVFNDQTCVLQLYA